MHTLFTPLSLKRAVSSHRAESIDLLPRSIDCLLTHLSLLPVLTVAAVSPPLPSTHYTHTTGTAVATTSLIGMHGVWLRRSLQGRDRPVVGRRAYGWG